MKYKAIIYEVVKNADGSITLKPVTSALYLTVAQVASAVGVSRQTIYQQIKEGKLPASHVGCICKVGVDDFAAYLKQIRLAEYERPMKKADLRG